MTFSPADNDDDPAPVGTQDPKGDSHRQETDEVRAGAGMGTISSRLFIHQ